MIRRIRGLWALVLLLALAVGLPWALASTIGNPLHQWSSIKSGDMSDQDVIAIMAAIAYLAWATFVLALLVELAADLTAAVTRRPRRSIRIPLLGVQQHFARTLIAGVLLLAPAVISVVGPATSAFASPAPTVATQTASPHAQPASSVQALTAPATRREYRPAPRQQFDHGHVPDPGAGRATHLLGPGRALPAQRPAVAGDLAAQRRPPASGRLGHGLPADAASRLDGDRARRRLHRHTGRRTHRERARRRHAVRTGRRGRRDRLAPGVGHQPEPRRTGRGPIHRPEPDQTRLDDHAAR